MLEVRSIHLKAPPVTNPTQLTLAAQDFYLDREAKRCTQATLIWYRAYVDALVDWLTGQGVTDPAMVTAGRLRAWLVGLSDQHLGDRTIHHHAAATRAFFNFCADEGIVSVSPMAKVKMPRLPKEVLPAFTQDDVKKLLDACTTPRDTALVLCLLDSGCRAFEFVNLKIGDVDTFSGEIQVKHGKGKKERVVYLGLKARKALRKYLSTRPEAKPTDDLWVTARTSEQLTVRGLQSILRKLGERAHVEHCHPHTFRRSFALFSLRAGMDIYSLQRIMGHASLTVLFGYLALVQDDFARAHREHGAVDQWL